MDIDQLKLISSRQEQQGSSGADQFLKLVQNPFAAALQANAFWASLGTSLGVTLLIAILFSLLRPHNSVVYAPKLRHADDRHAPPPVGRGIFAWFTPIIKTQETQLVDKVGLDATIFLRFTRMCRNLFLVMSVIGCGIIIPTNIADSDHNITYGLSAFQIMTPMYMFGRALWSHVVCAWLFDIIIVYFLWRNYRAVTRLRRRYFESPEYQMSLHSRTLMVTDIPPSYRTDEGILRITDAVEQTAGLPGAAVGRNVKELPLLIEQHQRQVRELESVLAKYLKDPDKIPSSRPTCRPSKHDRKQSQGHKVDAIEYLTGRIRDLEIEIKDVRDSIDKRNAMSYGFASYEKIDEAHAVAYSARKKHPHGSTIRLAPRPNDLIWNNLALSKKARGWKRLRNNIWVAVLTLVWIVPNAMIAIFLSDLSNLGSVWPAFQTQLNGHPITWSAVQGIASPAVLSLVYLILPIIFRRLSIRAGDTTKTSREKHVTHKLYAFFVFNNLIVFSAFSAVWKFVAKVVEARQGNEGVWDAINKGEFFVKMMIALCTVSPFWVTWLLQRNLGAAADLSQIINLTWIWFARTFMSPTPRQAIEWTAPPPFDYATYYNYFLFYATVALCFATLQPIVLPVTALYFTVDAWLKKYLLLYVFITKTESGGQFWRILYNRFIFAAVLANVIVALVVKARGTWTQIIAMAPLPLLMLGFKWYCSRAFDDQCKYYTKAPRKDAEALVGPGKQSHRKDRLGTRFGHPALYRSLITPMVHAKARGVLAQVYRGRIESDGASAAGYSDIVMESMSRSEPGKAARFAPNAPFEVVPENRLDFAYYKNRNEFGEEHGGGEIYGRPLDLVSERSQTPQSFAGGYDSPSFSRAQSPAPSYSRRFEDESGTTYPADYHHPAYRDPSYGDLGDHGLRESIYTHTNESESRLLAGAQSMPVSTPREQIRMDRWRTGGSGSGNDTLGEDPVSYDSFPKGRA
ncbi:MAG: hypothetical protein M1830_006906 [Pleopsidium flavum]|nr:MAG: hypothetical protein M1830_006906 [Pleopsidium flavum]